MKNCYCAYKKSDAHEGLGIAVGQWLPFRSSSVIPVVLQPGTLTPMLKLVLLAALAVVSALAWTEYSRQVAAKRIATLDASWDAMELRESNGCFNDALGDAIAIYRPKRETAQFDAAVAQSRSITIAVAAAVSILACLLISTFIRQTRMRQVKGFHL